MTKVRRFMFTQLFAAAASVCLTFPALGAVTYQSGDADWFNMTLGMGGSADYPLATGANGESFYTYGLTCFGQGCEGLPWGGSLLSDSWSVGVSNDALNYNFSALEGTDSGAVVTDMSLFLLFHTDRKPLVFGFQNASMTPPGPNCIDCQDSFSWSSGSQTDFGGGYYAFVLATSDASIGYGENVVSDRLHVVVAEVPEPATWAMMLVGLSGMGAALRSQRKRPAAA